MQRAILSLSVLLALGVNGAPAAWGAIPIPAEDNREASFLPPPVSLLQGEGKAEPAKPAASAEGDKLEPPVDMEKLSLDNLTRGEKKDLKTPPPFQAPPAVAPAPVAATPAVVSAPPAPAPAVESAAVEPAKVEQAPVKEPVVIEGKAPAAPPVLEKVSAEVPVTAKPLADVDPETLGLLAQSNGGLGAAMWKDTPRALVDRLMPAVGLPTASPTLNDLARRMLLSTAAVPAGSASGARTLTSQRIEKLVALGAASEAWKLAMLAPTDRVDSITLRLLAEAALLGSDSAAVCAKLPELISANNKPDESGIEWQKALIVCKLRAKDDNAVQLALDLLNEQRVKDDLFLTLINRNIYGHVKQLPRQLTPLRALNLAILQQTELPLPPEIYARPEAALIGELLKTHSTDEKARLLLAEKAAEKGVISAAQLGAVYRSVVLTQEEAAAALTSIEKGPRTRAMVYQALLNEQVAQKKIELAHKLIADVEGGALMGSLGTLAAETIASIAPTTDYNLFAARAARLMAIGGRMDQAQAWLKLAQGVEGRLPDVGAQLTAAWPVFVLSGLVPDGTYAQGLKQWLDHALASGEAKDHDDRTRRQDTGRVLVALAAAGYAVPEEAWARVIDAMPSTKQLTPDPVLIERLRAAGAAGRKGETVLLALWVAGGGVAETPVSVLADTIRALRQAGLSAEAQALAKETVLASGG